MIIADATIYKSIRKHLLPTNKSNKRCARPDPANTERNVNVTMLPYCKDVSSLYI